jgi:hypothetical protein
MLELKFQIESATPDATAAAPLLIFKLKIEQTVEPLTPIQTIALRCQIRIEPGKRKYQPAEQARLSDLFSTPDRWSQTVRPMLWTHTSVIVPPFVEATVVDLPAPCSYDFNVAATRYFAGLEDGDIPLTFLFSGTVFYEHPERGLQVFQLPWDREASFRLSVQLWKQMMERYYPNSAWLCLRKDVFDRLDEFRSRHGVPTLEQAVEKLLANDN